MYIKGWDLKPLRSKSTTMYRSQHREASMNNIRIKVSHAMTDHLGMYGNENGMLRIPAELRQNLGLENGHQFTLNSINNTKVVLTIGSAFKKDAEQDGGVCYVTKSVFDQVNLETTDQHNITQIKGITLGCDPEFFLIDRETRKLLSAQTFFKKWGEIGCDGVLAELRPSPSLTARGLTDNIYELILSTREILKLTQAYDPTKIIMHASSSYSNGMPAIPSIGATGYATAGFHLHFGLPKDILGRKPDIMTLMFRIVRAMDYFVGLPAIMLECDDESKRRSNTQVAYGKPSDFRLDSRTLEYRVPGGSLLRHPILTNGLIALGATVTEDIVSKVNMYTNGFKQLYWMQNDERIKEIYPNMLSTKDMYPLMCTPCNEMAKTHLDNIYNDVSNMIGFAERKEEIDAFFHHIQANIKYNNNIEDNWRNFYEQQGVRVHQPPNAVTAYSSAS